VSGWAAMAAEWAVAGGTALLAIATFVLALSARRQVKIAADHVVAIQRPLVSPVITREWLNEGVHQARIALKNGGLGPAYNVQGGLYWTGGSGGASSILRTTLGSDEYDRGARRRRGHQHQLGSSEGLPPLPRLGRRGVADALPLQRDSGRRPRGRGRRGGNYEGGERSGGQAPLQAVLQAAA
jgi:hypothetical protein